MGDLRELTRTARSYVVSRSMAPAEAWDEAAAKHGGKAKTGYPRTMWLALCEAGLVKGVPPGDYAGRAGDMRKYAPRMVELLVEDPDYEYEPEALFTDATEGKVPLQGQLDVLFGLYNHGLIEIAALAA